MTFDEFVTNICISGLYILRISTFLLVFSRLFLINIDLESVFEDILLYSGSEGGE